MVRDARRIYCCLGILLCLISGCDHQSKIDYQSSLDLGLEWLNQNEQEVKSTHFSTLWYFMAKLSSLTMDPEITKMVDEYRAGNRNRYLNNPLAFEVYESSPKKKYSDEWLEIFNFYNLFLIYGHSCSSELESLDVIKKQLLTDFCKSWLRSPSCKTHQLMGFLHMNKYGCGDQESIRKSISTLVEDIDLILAIDGRVLDAYIQRVLMLYEAGKGDSVKKRWIDKIVLAQNSDGGWDDFVPLVRLNNEKYFGMKAKSFESRTLDSDFHATVQAVLVLAYFQAQQKTGVDR